MPEVTPAGANQDNALEIFEEIVRLGRYGQPSALATVIASNGSSPRKSGAGMLVKNDASIIGSVGGGSVEQDVIAAALEVMRTGAPRLLDFHLTERFGHVCGGTMHVFIQPNPIEYSLIIAGAGHVGSALVPLARYAGYRVTVIDPREEYARPERLPEADRVIADDAALAMARLAVPPSTAIVIATTDFQQDFDAVKAALQTPAGFIGLIGSKRKKAALEETLRQAGYPPEQISRITVPVGLDIGAETPREIAVSIIAQLIACRKNNAL